MLLLVYCVCLFFFEIVHVIYTILCFVCSIHQSSYFLFIDQQLSFGKKKNILLNLFLFGELCFSIIFLFYFYKLWVL